MATTVRWEKAQRALAQAEATTGVHPRSHQPSRTGDVGREHRGQPPTTSTDRVPVPPALLGLFPDGALARGSVTRISGAMSTLFALAATAMGQEGWCAFVGVPDAGLAAAAELGLTLQRVVVVPDPGARSPGVLAALVDGVDVLVLGGSTGMTGQDRRRLTPRVRRQGAVLLTTGSWEQPDLDIEVLSRSWHGMGRGDGLLQHGEVELQARHRRRPLPLSCRVHVGSTGLISEPEKMTPVHLGDGEAPGGRPGTPAQSPGDGLSRMASAGKRSAEQLQKEPA